MASSDRSVDFAPLEGSTTALLTTFRRGGEAVGAPLSIVESYVSYLRRKVDAVEPRLIHTIRGVGYVLRLPDP